MDIWSSFEQLFGITISHKPWKDEQAIVIVSKISADAQIECKSSYKPEQPQPSSNISGGQLELLVIPTLIFHFFLFSDRYMEWSRKVKREVHHAKYMDKQLPFVGCALGIFFAALCIVLDHIAHGQESYIAHPILKVGITVTVAMVCYFIAKIYRKEMRKMNASMLEPPVDLFSTLSDDTEDSEEDQGSHPKQD